MLAGRHDDMLDKRMPLVTPCGDRQRIRRQAIAVLVSTQALTNAGELA